VGETHCSRAPYILNLGVFVDHAQGTKTLVFPVAITDVVFVTSHCGIRKTEGTYEANENVCALHYISRNGVSWSPHSGYSE